VAVRGAVQGVGFRPFVFRLATELGLAGTALNDGDGVFIEAEGPRTALEVFLGRLRAEKPRLSRITSLEASWLEPVGLGPFRILESNSQGPKRALLPPDIATCAECAAEVSNPQDRRYCYPFTNCVHCGPRFSIIETLPYDRARTTMRGFEMCPQCRAEYEDPSNRRFHAQPNACAVCGPHIELWNEAGSTLLSAKGGGAEGAMRVIKGAASALKEGRIVAVKGLGGFHLMADAAGDADVERLRARKRREEKPFAVMFPSLECLRAHCEVSSAEDALLAGPESPIVLLRKRSKGAGLSMGLAPGNPTLGAMLPYTPLHLLLLREFGGPVVATSGNLSDEPICTDEQEAVRRLSGIADVFLVHNRPIVRHVDDSIVRMAAGRELVLRRARGYAPLPIAARGGGAAAPALGVGAHLKTAVAFAAGGSIFLSQHIGDLETDAAFEAFQRVCEDLPRIYEAAPMIIAHDAHPAYLSTRYAEEASKSLGAALVSVQHHVAHVLSCMAENEVEPPALGVAWDGTGYGLDGTVWGGEFFEVTKEQCKRVGRMRRFRLPGGEAAVKEPWRSAAGVLFEMYGEGLVERATTAGARTFLSVPGAEGPPQTKGGQECPRSRAELGVMERMLAGGINSPLTSSAGRLFDAVASLTGLRQVTRHEGQAAMQLEFAAESRASTATYPAPLAESEGLFEADWAPMVRAMLDDVRDGVPIAEISAAFHNTLADWIIAAARRVGHRRVVLSGGCFQNTRLLETTIGKLRGQGFTPVWHQRVPPNDGGIALGQVIAARRWPRPLPDGAQTAESP
jgi:hydrogenase maturation protein HypF